MVHNLLPQLLYYYKTLNENNVRRGACMVWFYLRTRREKNQNITHSSTPKRIVRRDKLLRIREKG